VPFRFRDVLEEQVTISSRSTVGRHEIGAYGSLIEVGRTRDRHGQMAFGLDASSFYGSLLGPPARRFALAVARS